MLAVIKNPDEEPEMKEIDNTLRALQDAVAGHIETVRFGKVAAIINEEGRLMGLKENTLGFVGPVVFVGVRGEEFRGLTEDEAWMIMECV